MFTRSSRKSAPTFSECAPRPAERLSSASKVSRSRAVGEKVAVPKLAAPEMLTAGPVPSLTGALSRLRADVARVEARDVVQVVARRQLGRGVNLVIEAEEEVGGVEPGRHDAG
jgi:hypothetical protein